MDTNETELELDQPSEKDYIYEDLFGSAYANDTVEFLPTKIQNQGAEKVTKMACSRYGICHAINAQNEYVKGKDGQRYFELPAKMYWEMYLKENPSAERDGATLQSALDQMKKAGFITGYTKVNGVEQMKQALTNVRPIYTGSKKANWVSVRDKKRYELGTGYAHIFCIVGYNHEGFIAINSYGESNGKFIVPYDLVDSLFSCYALHDDRDAEVLKKA